MTEKGKQETTVKNKQLWEEIGRNRGKGKKWEERGKKTKFLPSCANKNFLNFFKNRLVC